MADARHHQFLDGVIAGTAGFPPCVTRLALPAPTSWAPGRIECLTDAGEEVTWSGLVFGGWLASVADLFGGLVMFTVLPDGARFATAALDMSFDRPVVPGPIRIEATVAPLVAVDDREANVEVRVWQRNRVTTRARLVQTILRDREEPTDGTDIRRPHPGHLRGARRPGGPRPG